MQTSTVKMGFVQSISNVVKEGGELHVVHADSATEPQVCDHYTPVFQRPFSGK